LFLTAIIETRLVARRLELNSRRQLFWNFFLFPTASGTHPASYPMGTGGSYTGCMRSGREADHSSPSSAEGKEYMELYLHPQTRLHGVVFN